jgi:hypothetical protein
VALVYLVVLLLESFNRYSLVFFFLFLSLEGLAVELQERGTGVLNRGILLLVKGHLI